MKSPIFLCLAVLTVSGGSAVAQRADLVPPQRRALIVEKAQRIIQPRDVAAASADLKNPFSPPGFDRPDPAEAPPPVVEPARPVGPRNDRELLAAVAPRITPSGTAIISGEPILLFGQKKVKVGDQLSITFDGASYVLVIAAIERTSFTLRLNREEITRPIKPASTP